MRNVTVSLDEEVAQWVRVRAAEHDTSVSRFVGSMLQAQMESGREYEQAMGTFLDRRPRDLKAAGPYPNRDELHGRPLLR